MFLYVCVVVNNFKALLSNHSLISGSCTFWLIKLLSWFVFHAHCKKIIDTSIHIALFCTDKPENVTLNVNISSDRVCAGVTVKFTCTADANPEVDTYRLYDNGSMIVSMDGSGVWIRTLNTGGQFNYRCEANNSVGTETSSVTTLVVEGKLA